MTDLTASAGAFAPRGARRRRTPPADWQPDTARQINGRTIHAHLRPTGPEVAPALGCSNCGDPIGRGEILLADHTATWVGCSTACARTLTGG